MDNPGGSMFKFTKSIRFRFYFFSIAFLAGLAFMISYATVRSMVSTVTDISAENGLPIVNKVAQGIDAGRFQDFAATLDMTNPWFLEIQRWMLEIKDRITSYNVCYTKLLRPRG